MKSDSVIYRRRARCAHGLSLHEHVPHTCVMKCVMQYIHMYVCIVDITYKMHVTDKDSIRRAYRTASKTETDP